MTGRDLSSLRAGVWGAGWEGEQVLKTAERKGRSERRGRGCPTWCFILFDLSWRKTMNHRRGTSTSQESKTITYV
jgi:hypothetical protein